MSLVEAYDEAFLALQALSGLDNLVSGAGNMIEPGEFSPLLNLPVERLRAALAAMKPHVDGLPAAPRKGAKA